MGYLGWQKFHAADHPAPAERPAAQASADTLKYPVDAPQLTFLQIKPVQAFPEPLVEPLNARIVYDDNHTARVFSPLRAGSPASPPKRASKSKAGSALLRIDSPDFALGLIGQHEERCRSVAQSSRPMTRAKQLLDIQGIAQRDLESAEADLRQAEAEASRAKARLKNLASHTTTTEGQFILRAPIAGIVSERQVNAGSEVRPDASQPAVRHYRTAASVGAGRSAGNPAGQNQGLDSLFWLKWMHTRMKYSTGKSRSSGKRWTRSHAGYKCAVI